MVILHYNKNLSKLYEDRFFCFFFISFSLFLCGWYCRYHHLEFVFFLSYDKRMGMRIVLIQCLVSKEISLRIEKVDNVGDEVGTIIFPSITCWWSKTYEMLCERASFVLQKGVFYTPKGHLLHRKRASFATWKSLF